MLEPVNVVTFSWNLEKFGPNKTIYAEKISEHVVNSVSNVKVSVDRRTRYVGFLLEVSTSDKSAQALMDKLRETFAVQMPHEDFVVGVSDSGGGKHNSEKIIFFYNNRNKGDDKCAVTHLDYRDRMKDSLKIIAEEAKILKDKPRYNGNHKRKKAYSGYYFESNKFNTTETENHLTEGDQNAQNNVLRHFSYARPSTWYRHGCIIELDEYFKDSIFSPKFGGRRLKIASVHLPNPKLMEEHDDILINVMAEAKSNDVHIITGDFNIRNFKSEHYEDKSLGLGSTTYMKKSNTLSKSGNQWDKVVAMKDKYLFVKSIANINLIPTRDFIAPVLHDDSKSLTPLVPKPLVPISDHVSLTAVHQIESVIFTNYISRSLSLKYDPSTSNNIKRNVTYLDNFYAGAATIKNSKSLDIDIDHM